jgi:putative transposase
MYRLLRAQGETGDRRRHATHPARVKPELVATKPNQCWSWDITKLAGPARWTWFYLYVILLCQRTLPRSTPWLHPSTHPT